MKADKSLNKEFEQILLPFIERLKERDNVEGIVVLGGLGKRNHVDSSSDIDVKVFFNAKGVRQAAPEWLPTSVYKRNVC